MRTIPTAEITMQGRMWRSWWKRAAAEIRELCVCYRRFITCFHSSGIFVIIITTTSIIKINIWAFRSFSFWRESVTPNAFLFPSRLFCSDRLCGLVVRVSGYRYRCPGFDSRHCQIFLSLLVSLLRSIELKSSGSRSRKQSLTAVGTRCADHATPLYPQKLALTSRRPLCPYSSLAD